jgi:hypothetical protein
MRAGWSTRDVLIAAGLFAASATYLAGAWPNNIVGQDEGEILYGAKRIFDGQVMYRDFFDQIGPIAPHVLALVYGLFGVSMETARTSTAVLHGAIVVLMYTIARQLGVRPILAVLVGLTDIALFQPALSFTSPHWLATLLTLIVFWYVLRGPVKRDGQALVAGVLTALVGLTQQPKGAGTAFAVAIVLVRDLWGDRVDWGRWVGSSVRRLAAFKITWLLRRRDSRRLCGFDPCTHAPRDRSPCPPQGAVADVHAHVASAGRIGCRRVRRPDSQPHAAHHPAERGALGAAGLAGAAPG